MKVTCTTNVNFELQINNIMLKEYCMQLTLFQRVIKLITITTKMLVTKEITIRFAM